MLRPCTILPGLKSIAGYWWPETCTALQAQHLTSHDSWDFVLCKADVVGKNVCVVRVFKSVASQPTICFTVDCKKNSDGQQQDKKVILVTHYDPQSKSGSLTSTTGFKGWMLKLLTIVTIYHMSKLLPVWTLIYYIYTHCSCACAVLQCYGKVMNMQVHSPLGVRLD